MVTGRIAAACRLARTHTLPLVVALGRIGWENYLRAAARVASTQVQAPLVIHERGGYSPEVRRMLGEER